MQPPAAAASRAAQKETLAGISHDLQTSPALGALLERLSSAAAAGDALGAPDAEAAAVRRAAVREALDAHRREARVPKELAQRMARLESTGYHAWVEARAAGDWSRFEPTLSAWVDALRAKARAIDSEADAYTVLLQSYDKGNSRARLEEIFAELKQGLVPLLRDLRAARAAGKGPADPEWILAPEGGAPYDEGAQAVLCRELVLDLGFDLARGRVDASVHPFTGGAGPTDVRLTTRFKPRDVTESLTGAIHEAGHGLYEQGRPTGGEWEGLPVSEAAGMAAHESQSLLWERMVGLSREYSAYLLPRLAKSFPDSAFAEAAAAGGDEAGGAERLYGALNALRVPSYVRVEADEVHYPLHVLLRFEIEKALVDGSLAVSDVPAAWRAKALEYLGDAGYEGEALGPLQDVHFSAGALGYFPTYTLGAAMAVQIFAAAKEQIPGLKEQIARGEFAPLRSWLRERVHAKGSLYPSADALLESATGRPLDVQIFLKYLSDKYRPLYGI